MYSINLSGYLAASVQIKPVTSGLDGIPDYCWNSTAIGLIPLSSFLVGCCRRWDMSVAVSGLGFRYVSI